MLEERSDFGLAEKFERLLASSIPANQAPEELRTELRLTEQLRGLNLSAESHIQARFRAQLAHKIQGACPMPGSNIHHPTAHPHLWVSAMISMLLILVLVSNTPARAAIEHLFGYGYLPYAGFVPLSDTSVIQGPVTQVEQGWTVTIFQGIQDPQKTILWIGTNLDLSALSTAELILSDQTHLPIRSVQPNRETTVLIFPALPDQVIQTDLVLPGGWHLPIHWIAANEAGLAPTQVSVPFYTNTPYRSQHLQPPCIDIDPVTQICAQAAFIDSEGTHLLLQAFQSGQAVPLSYSATSGWRAISLKDETGRIYPIRRFEQGQEQDASVLPLRFAVISPEIDNVTLHLPAQALMLAGSTPTRPQTVDLPLRLPERVPTRSPTPGVVQNAPDHPIIVPTPGVNPPSFINP